MYKQNYWLYGGKGDTLILKNYLSGGEMTDLRKSINRRGALCSCFLWSGPRELSLDNGVKRLGRVCRSATDELVILGTYSPLSGSVNSVKREWQALPWCSCSSQVENVVRSQPGDHFKAGAPARAICPSPHLALEPPRGFFRPSPRPGRSPLHHFPPLSRARPPPHRAGTAAEGASSPPGVGLQKTPPSPPSWKRARGLRRGDGSAEWPLPPSPAQWAFSPLARGARCAADGCGESGSELRAAGERSSDGPWARSSPTVLSRPILSFTSALSHFQPRPSAETWPWPPPWGPQLAFARRNPVWGATLALSPLGPLEWWLRPFPGCLISRAAGPSLRPGGQRWAGDREIGVWDPLLLAVMTLSLRPSLQTSGKPKFPSWGSLEPQVVNLNLCLPRTSKVLSWYNWVLPNLLGWKSHQDAC